MLHPRFWHHAARIERALRGYPIYRPPFPKDAAELTISEGQENYAYFIDQQSARLSALQGLLADFDVTATLEEIGIHAVSDWVHRFSGHLIGANRYDSGVAYWSFARPWEGRHHGLNVIWDLGIFAGECIHTLNTSCRWVLDDGDGRRSGRLSYLRPCLQVSRRPGRCDILTVSMEVARAKRKLIKMGRPGTLEPNVAPDAFERNIRHWAALNSE
jgi:hypothetical protein